MPEAELQAFLYRSVTTNVRIGQLIEQGQLIDAPSLLSTLDGDARSPLDDFSFEAPPAGPADG